jgi:hypothetical protein
MEIQDFTLSFLIAIENIAFLGLISLQEFEIDTIGKSCFNRRLQAQSFSFRTPATELLIASEMKVSEKSSHFLWGNFSPKTSNATSNCFCQRF